MTHEPHEMLARWCRTENPDRVQSDWARLFGVSRPYFSQIVTGARRPSLAVAVRIERATAGAVPAASWVEPAAAGDATPSEGRAA